MFWSNTSLVGVYAEAFQKMRNHHIVCLPVEMTSLLQWLMDGRWHTNSPGQLEHAQQAYSILAFIRGGEGMQKKARWRKLVKAHMYCSFVQEIMLARISGHFISISIHSRFLFISYRTISNPVTSCRSHYHKHIMHGVVRIIVTSFVMRTLVIELIHRNRRIKSISPNCHIIISSTWSFHIIITIVWFYIILWQFLILSSNSRHPFACHLRQQFSVLLVIVVIFHCYDCACIVVMSNITWFLYRIISYHIISYDSPSYLIWCHTPCITYLSNIT